MAVAHPPTRRPVSPVLFGLMAAALLAPLVSCGKFQARVELKKGNAYYKNEQYREALAQFQKGLALDPSADFAWRSVGLSAMALYHPGDDSEVQRGYAQTAIDAFERYLRTHPDDRKVEDYLLTTLVQSGRYDSALEMLEAEAVEHPGDATIRAAIVNTLIKSGDLERALGRARSGGRPEPDWLYSIAVSAWRRSYENPLLDAAARGKVVDLGLDACRQALQLAPDSDETMTYTNLLYREKAKLAVDPAEASRYTALADEWLAKALSTRAGAAGKQGS